MPKFSPTAVHWILLACALVSAVGTCLSQAFPGASWLVYVGAATALATELRTLLAPSVSPAVNQAAALASAAKKA